MAETDGARLRAADTDRLRVVDTLRAALDEGRLNLSEFDERVGAAYRAVTYSDLDLLLADLPRRAPAPLAVPDPVTTVPAAKKPKKRRRIPLALMILWTILGAGVAVNLVVWLTVCVATGHLMYFWPAWVALPPGAALLAVTIGVDWMRRTHASDPHGPTSYGSD